MNEIYLMLNPIDNRNYILGLSKSKLTSDTITESLNINGYQTRFRKVNLSRNGDGGLFI